MSDRLQGHDSERVITAAEQGRLQLRGDGDAISPPANAPRTKRAWATLECFSRGRRLWQNRPQMRCETPMSDSPSVPQTPQTTRVARRRRPSSTRPRRPPRAPDKANPDGARHTQHRRQRCLRRGQHPISKAWRRLRSGPACTSAGPSTAPACTPGFEVVDNSIDESLAAIATTSSWTNPPPTNSISVT